MSPTATFRTAAHAGHAGDSAEGRGGVYPGYGDEGGRWEGYTGYPPTHRPGSHIQLFSVSGPYPRPNEGLFRSHDEVS